MLAMIPLGSILFEVVKNGISAISIEFLTQPQGSIIRGGGGVGPAIQGTLITVGFASLIGVPIGILAGIYLSEYAGNSKFAYTVRFLNNVMTGLPSIVIGIVGYMVLVVTIGSFNITAGAVALSIIMIPIVVAVTEETLKLVPNSVREARTLAWYPKMESYDLYHLKERQRRCSNRHCSCTLQNCWRNCTAYNDNTWNQSVLPRIP